LRVETSVLGRPMEVRYQVRGAGCGVTAIALNGTPLTFTSRHNPHRRGAAVVDRNAVIERLTAAKNVLAIEVG
jgi:hypothetical protein